MGLTPDPVYQAPPGLIAAIDQCVAAWNEILQTTNQGKEGSTNEYHD